MKPFLQISDISFPINESETWDWDLYRQRICDVVNGKIEREGVRAFGRIWTAITEPTYWGPEKDENDTHQGVLILIEEIGK